MSIDKDLSDRPMEGRAPGDSFGKEGVPADLRKALAQPAVRVELDEHLDEERAERYGEALPEGANPLPNRRNGSSPKTVATESGKVLPGIPRHRNGSFDPIPIAKDRRRFPKVDTRILGLYARGMTTHESQSQIEAIRVDIRRCRTRSGSAPRLSCQMGPGTSWACGFRPMRARRSGPRI